MAIKPGVIPLRPLSLSDIFNAAVGYIRANPKATLGLTTVVVLITQILSLLLQVGPLAFTGQVGATSGQELTAPMVVGSIASAAAGALATALAAILLSGMLTVVVGPGGVRFEDHHRRSLGAGPRPAAGADRTRRAGGARGGGYWSARSWPRSPESRSPPTPRPR